jgi:hypothetical protein
VTTFRTIPTVGALDQLNAQTFDAENIEDVAVRAFGPGAVVGQILREDHPAGAVAVFVGGRGKVGEIHPVAIQHEHEWQLVEDGYQRFWRTELREDGTVVASDDNYSEDGTGAYLICNTCAARRDVDNIVWQ